MTKYVAVAIDEEAEDGHAVLMPIVAETFEEASEKATWSTPPCYHVAVLTRADGQYIVKHAD